MKRYTLPRKWLCKYRLVISIFIISSIQELETQQKSILKSHESPIPWELSHFTNSLTTKVANVGDVLLVKSSEASPEPAELVPVETTKKNLQEIALALSMGASVLLEGETGVGKTALIEEVARAVCKKGKPIHCGGLISMRFGENPSWRPD